MATTMKRKLKRKIREETKYRDKTRTSRIIKLSILSRVFCLVLLVFFIMIFALSKLSFFSIYSYFSQAVVFFNYTHCNKTRIDPTK